MSNVKSVMEIQVIQVVSITGDGSDENPIRELVEYYSEAGKFLAGYDHWAESTKAKPSIFEEVKKWNLTDQWTGKDLAQSCWRCGTSAIVHHKDNLCFPCWEKLWKARHLLEEFNA